MCSAFECRSSHGPLANAEAVGMSGLGRHYSPHNRHQLVVHAQVVPRVRFQQTPTPPTLRPVSLSRLHVFTFARLRPLGALNG